MRSIDDVVDQYDWDVISRKLTGYAVCRLGKARVADAEQVAQEALRRLFDPEYADWDPDGEKDLMDDLRSRANGIISNLWKQGKRRGKHEEFDDAVTDSAENPEARVLNEMQARQAVQMLMSKLDGDEVCGEMLLLMVDGVDKPAAIAAETGWDIKAVYNARRRMTPHVADVAEALERNMP